jgi:hypothetical protein
MTEHVKEQPWSRLLHDEETDMQKLWRSVSSLPPSLGLASVVFEAYIHSPTVL